MPRLPVAKSSNTQHIYFPSLWITIPISSFFLMAITITLLKILDMAVMRTIFINFGKRNISARKLMALSTTFSFI